jgi:nucleoside-diphosphate-sugar epimerase
MTKILITGANSFVGSNFKRFSQYKDIEEISLYENGFEDVDFGKYDVVLHLAAIVHQSKKNSESEYFKVNKDLCLLVAEKARISGVKHFVFLSTLKVYGDFVKSHELRNENSQCFPDDAYGRSKYEAEIGLKRMENSDFIVSIIRPPLVYGEGVRANMLSLIKLIELSPLLPFGNIYNKRDFIYTENLVGFIDKIIEKRASGIFIVKDDGALSTTELIYHLSKSLHRKVTLFTVPSILIRIATHFFPSFFNKLFGSMEFDNSETIKLLNYRPPYSTEEGIKRWMNSFKTAKRMKSESE